MLKFDNVNDFVTFFKYDYDVVIENVVECIVNQYDMFCRECCAIIFHCDNIDCDMRFNTLSTMYVHDFNNIMYNFYDYMCNVVHDVDYDPADYNILITNIEYNTGMLFIDCYIDD